jgi:B-box zinc finger/zinc-RING finger domain
MWNTILTCERCEEKFNIENRSPVILPDCGHTFCEYCVADLLVEPEKACPTCQTAITTSDSAKFIKNQKIHIILERTKNGITPEMMLFQSPEGDFVFCPRHTDKPIEYFCKQCSITVCVKCMFDEHNGHELIQIEEMANSLK